MFPPEPKAITRNAATKAPMAVEAVDSLLALNGCWVVKSKESN